LELGTVNTQPDGATETITAPGGEAYTIPAMLAERLSRPTSSKGQRQRVLLAYLLVKHERGEIPTSVHFCWYELEHQGVVTKARRARTDGKIGRRPDQDLTDAATHLRDVGIIPWDWIVDERREVYRVYAAPTVHAYLAAMADIARIDPWVGTLRPVILCEAATIAGVLARAVGDDFAVDVAPTSGQCRGFLETDVTELLRDPNTRVLYVGDYDLSGDQIEANTRRVLERATGRRFTRRTWERLALTKRQTERLRARGVEPIVKADKRYNPPRVHEAYETEALGQAVVVRLVRARLRRLCPVLIEDVHERERVERADARRRLLGITDEQ
jgi:hypothetical protein